MKNIKNILTNSLIVGVAALTLISCDLELQKEWEYEREPLSDVATGMTALEWLRSINENPAFNSTDTTGEFSYLLEAIERTGMEAEFDDPSHQRTFFLLRDAAWFDGAEIMQHVTDNRLNPLDSIEDNAILEHILKYHILDEVVDQINGIPQSDKHFYFQTLVPGDTGIMEIHKRLLNLEMGINKVIPGVDAKPEVPSNMPSFSKGAPVRRHNYRFTNGVGHQMTDYLRYDFY